MSNSEDIKDNQENYEGFFPSLLDYRMSIQERGDDDFTIVSKLKTFLLDNNVEESELDHIINSFYDFYGIPVEEIFIESVPIYREPVIQRDIPHVFQLPLNQPPVRRRLLDDLNNVMPPRDEIEVIYNGIPYVSDINQRQEIVDAYGAVMNLLMGYMVVHNDPMALPPLPMSNVVVTTSKSDLEKIEAVKLEEKLEEKCSICMSEMEEGEVVSTLKCNHKYHKECVEEYLSHHSNKCPICRANVSEQPDYKY